MWLSPCSITPPLRLYYTYSWRLTARAETGDQDQDHAGLSCRQYSSSLIKYWQSDKLVLAGIKLLGWPGHTMRLSQEMLLLPAPPAASSSFSILYWLVCICPWDLWRIWINHHQLQTTMNPSGCSAAADVVLLLLLWTKAASHPAQRYPRLHFLPGHWTKNKTSPSSVRIQWTSSLCTHWFSFVGGGSPTVQPQNRETSV